VKIKYNRYKRGGFGMNLFFRVLLTIYAIILAVISVLSMIVTIKPDVFLDISSYMYYNILTAGRGASFAMFFLSLVIFGLNITYLFSGIRMSKDKKGVSKYTNIGEIKISLNSIENIALNASRRLNGVKDTKAHVSKSEDGVSVTIKAVVLADINIPDVSSDIQVKVKNSIESATGVRVNDVKVMVENIYAGYKPRLE
jgi:uncharacterized alkaline shock family protein YloU